MGVIDEQRREQRIDERRRKHRDEIIQIVEEAYDDNEDLVWIKEILHERGRLRTMFNLIKTMSR